MSTMVAALLVVSLASMAFRVVPLLGARQLPVGVARTAGWAGTSILAAITVRSVLHHQDPGVPWATLLAAVSVSLGLFLAARGRSVLTVLAAAVVCYLTLGTIGGAVAGTLP